MSSYHPVVEELVRQVGSRPELSAALQEAIVAANLEGIKTLPDYYVYLDHLVTLVPTTRPSVVGFTLELYYINDCSPGGFLRRDPEFQKWLHAFVAAWGKFLDSPESAKDLDRFGSLPGFNLSQYQEGPSGWKSFNQFFARQVKPGVRPIDGDCDDSIVVSPADSTLVDTKPICADSNVHIKGIEFSISQLLGGSEYEGEFAGGTFTHSLLNTNDYHRFHTPVGGKVADVQNISGSVGIVVTKQDGKLTPSQGPGFEAWQERGLLVLEDTPAGLVALLPVGMAQISSVVITAEKGVSLRKGEEFGYFQFGGSDIVTLYQKGRFEFDEKHRKYPNEAEWPHVNQGRRIGAAKPPASEAGS